MLAFVTILIVLLGFFIQSNKKYTLVMLLWMWVLFAFNTLNGDYLSYEKIYSHIAANNTRVAETYEELFVFFCRIGSRQFHWSYQQFIIAIASFSVFLFAIVLKLYCGNNRQNLVISLFMIFLYWMFICQYRTFISLMLVLIGIYFLERINDVRGIVLFLGFILLGVTFHRMAALYVVVLAVKYLERKQLVLLMPISMMSVLVLRHPALTAFISKYVAGYKMDRWLYADGSRTVPGIVILILIRVALTLIETYCYEDMVRVDADDRTLKRMDFFLKITIVCLAFLPLEMLQKDYERLARVSLFLSFVFFALFIENYRFDHRHVPLSVILFSGYFGMYLISFYISFNGWFLHNLVPILSYNSLFPF